MTPKARIERMVYARLHVDGCDPDREAEVVRRIARSAFVAGWVAVQARGWVHPSWKRRWRMDARRAWEGK